MKGRKNNRTPAIAIVAAGLNRMNIITHNLFIKKVIPTRIPTETAFVCNAAAGDFSRTASMGVLAR